MWFTGWFSLPCLCLSCMSRCAQFPSAVHIISHVLSLCPSHMSSGKCEVQMMHWSETSVLWECVSGRHTIPLCVPSAVLVSGTSVVGEKAQTADERLQCDLLCGRCSNASKLLPVDMRDGWTLRVQRLAYVQSRLAYDSGHSLQINCTPDVIKGGIYTFLYAYIASHCLLIGIICLLHHKA